QPEPARWLECLGHVRYLACGTNAEHCAEAHGYEITDERAHISAWACIATNGEQGDKQHAQAIANHRRGSGAAYMSMIANAAEIPPYPRPVAPPVYVPPPFTWTGFYIGANLGGAWGQRNLTDTLLGLSLSNVNEKGAFIGGGQLGYNYQFGNVVLGIEAD